MKAHILGFPRIGVRREMKRAAEAYWQGKMDLPELHRRGQQIRRDMWARQHAAGLDWVQVGDFAWYDQVLNTSAMVGAVPGRFGLDAEQDVDLDTLFCMGRGQAPNGMAAVACEMTKWFDTNYHYIVPEFSADSHFRLAFSALFAEIKEAQSLKYAVKPVLLGPLSYLWLGKTRDGSDKLALLERLLPVYQGILQRLDQMGLEWVQLDEPILALDLPSEWQQAFKRAYQGLDKGRLRLMVASYFGAPQDNLQMMLGLPVDGWHLDICRGRQDLETCVQALPKNRVLSLGPIDGRNVWRHDMDSSLQLLQPIADNLGSRLWIGSSCSLLHCPVDLDVELQIDQEMRDWLSFATQKCKEVVYLRDALSGHADEVYLAANRDAIRERRSADRIHRGDVRAREQRIDTAMLSRKSLYAERRKKQQESLSLPLFPTTTIGSFPQTIELRQARRDWRAGRLSETEYEQRMRDEIRLVIQRQEAIGLDVLVHGEAERNDMVEYFGEMLEGFLFTDNGWVQSYGSRCVKPPIIFGDVARAKPMTLEWTRFAAAQSKRPVKGMLTGPLTMLCWSFVRDDRPRSEVARQIALALRDEVGDLEQIGTAIIQIDEPAIREGLPLRRAEWEDYLRWAVDCFRLATTGVSDETQIHTHMCYSEFNDIIEKIADMDADVITIETSRSNMELLEAFERFSYPNEIGPGVYDIHSPNIPTAASIVDLLQAAARYIPLERLWVNPDCGLKTRGWKETTAALENMVDAALQLRQEHEQNPQGKILEH